MVKSHFVWGAQASNTISSYGAVYASKIYFLIQKPIYLFLNLYGWYGESYEQFSTFATSSPTISPKKIILPMASSVYGVSISQAGVERSLRPRSSTCNCAPVSIATATACRVTIAGVVSRQAATARILHSLALSLANSQLLHSTSTLISSPCPAYAT
jgi:hypothetical protein